MGLQTHSSAGAARDLRPEVGALMLNANRNLTAYQAMPPGLAR